MHRMIRTFPFCLLICLVFLCLNACGSAEKKQNQSEDSNETDISVKSLEDSVITRLYSDYTADPRSPFQKEINQIIDYAVENNLPLTGNKSGLYSMVLKPGTGVYPRWGLSFTAHYTVSSLEGKVYDSTYKRDKPFTDVLGQVIPAWNEGLIHMQEGGKSMFISPSHLAYGEAGFGDIIPPNTVLVFEIELIRAQ